MRAGAIAKRYAQAAFEVAQSRNAADAWLAGLQQLAAAAADPAILRWLVSSKVAADRKETVLIGALANPDPLLVNLVRLLIARGRIAILPEIAAAFERQVNQSRNIAHAEVTTAVEIDAAEAARIAEQLSTMTGSTVRVQTRVDPAILGGVVAQIGDRVIDGSVRTRLLRLRRELAGRA